MDRKCRVLDALQAIERQGSAYPILEPRESQIKEGSMTTNGEALSWWDNLGL